MAQLVVNNITKTFTLSRGFFQAGKSVVHAVNDVSLSLEKGKVTAILGESGSGKTTLGRIICRLTPADSGRVLIDDRDIMSYSRVELASKVQMIFQDPFASLNPKLTIGTILSEPVLGLAKEEKNYRIEETLRLVGLSADILPSYPHQFSGGQRQRIAIARALLKRPEIIVADEPLSALDVSIQNQLLKLLLDLNRTLGLSLLFISHDITTAGLLSDYCIVMKNGTIVEEGPTGRVISTPENDYTKRLLAAVPGTRR